MAQEEEPLVGSDGEDESDIEQPQNIEVLPPPKPKSALKKTVKIDAGEAKAKPPLPDHPNLETLDLSKLDGKSPEIIARQATVNIGTIGHVAHGKSTVVKVRYADNVTLHFFLSKYLTRTSRLFQVYRPSDSRTSWKGTSQSSSVMRMQRFTNAATKAALDRHVIDHSKAIKRWIHPVKEKGVLANTSFYGMFHSSIALVTTFL